MRKSNKPKNSVRDAYRRRTIRKVLLVLSIICFLISLCCLGVVGYDYFKRESEVKMVNNVAKEVGGDFGDTDNKSAEQKKEDAAIDKTIAKGIIDKRGENKNNSKGAENKPKKGHKFDEEYPIANADGIDRNLLRKINFRKLQGINPDATRWLYLPGTGINSYVMQERRVGHYYYLWRNINKSLNDYGSLFVPKTPGDYPDAHTLIFGHRTYGTFGDVVFAKMPDYYANKKQAQKNRYIYVYYPDHSERWKIYLAKDTKASDPIYQIPLTKGSQDYSKALANTRVNCRYIMENAPDMNTSTLVLSTCNSSVRHDVRFISVFVPDEKFTYSTATIENFN